MPVAFLSARKSIGERSAMSALVQTATTPGIASAAEASTETILPCALGERTIAHVKLMRES